jgi:hypothetical protein
VALNEDRAEIRIQPRRNVQRGGFTNLAMVIFWILVDGDGVQIDNAEEILLLRLFGGPAAN